MDSDPGDKTPLPAKDFCNSWGKGNPVLGKGALGNSYTSHMYYTGNDREAMVRKVQTMLIELGYDVGPKGADGKFGNDTEKAVKEFQKVHEDWGGEKLNVDGLVGPETADALNRAMVGRWYDLYRTPAELSPDVALVTAVTASVQETVSVKLTREKKIRLVFADADAATIKEKQRHPLPLNYYKEGSLPPPDEAV